jgi:pyruvate kinase
MIRTKIVCTIGPASREPDILRRLIRAGLNVARLNFSHGDHTYHGDTIARIRKASDELGKPVALLADLQGPKLRVGTMNDQGILLHTGEIVTLTAHPVMGHRPEEGESKAVIPIQFPDLPKDVKAGEQILLDDGLMELKVLSSTATDIRCEVVIGGLLLSNKGLNMPNTRLSIPSITEKDWADLNFSLEQEVDWIALSFVREADEVYRLKQHIARTLDHVKRLPQVISKIEKPEALDCIDQIIEASDGIMVARGDLGIEIPTERVPLVQKRLIHACNAAGKPVITATQMLDSMIRNPRPTRAEASDVANAILDGTDAIMLSGETASGQYPVESVETMVRIASVIEPTLFPADKPWSPPSQIGQSTSDITDAVGLSTCETAQNIKAAAIITATASGKSARAIARFRPSTPIVAVTPSPVVQRQLMLSWGVIPLLSKPVDETVQVVRQSVIIAAGAGLVKDGDRVVITAGIANNMPGMTNLMMVETVELAGRVDFKNATNGDN